MKHDETSMRHAPANDAGASQHSKGCANVINAVPMQDALGSHIPQLYRFALARTRDRDWAAEAVQETLLAALENGASFAGRAALRTWLTAILKHKIIDFQRARQRSALNLGPATWQASEPVEPPAPRSVWSDPEYALEHKRLMAAFDQAFAALPEAAARVFHMREVQGRSTAEVSKMLGISENNCCVILHRARSALRGLLDARGCSPCAY
jgi:RNA polymerase sigma-70 factor (TIGR02943 family)